MTDSILNITIKDKESVINKLTSSNEKESVILPIGDNKLINWNNGFNFGYYDNSVNITSFDLSQYKTSEIKYMNQMFYKCSNITSLDLSNFNTDNVVDMNTMFSECSALTSLNLSNFNTNNVIYMDCMFQFCSSLTSLDLSNFNTSKVRTLNGMFYSCSSLESIDLSNFDISNVIFMFDMFDKCDKLTHIKCKQKFKEWCITNKTNISLPETMINGTVGNDSSYNWEIVDYSE